MSCYKRNRFTWRKDSPFLRLIRLQSTSFQTITSPYFSIYDSLYLFWSLPFECYPILIGFPLFLKQCICYPYQRQRHLTRSRIFQIHLGTPSPLLATFLYCQPLPSHCQCWQPLAANPKGSWTLHSALIALHLLPWQGHIDFTPVLPAHVVKDYTNKAKTDMFLPLSER